MKPNEANFALGMPNLNPGLHRPTHLSPSDDSLANILAPLSKEALINLLLRLIESIISIINPNANINDLSNVITSIICPATNWPTPSQSSR